MSWKQPSGVLSNFMWKGPLGCLFERGFDEDGFNRALEYCCNVVAFEIGVVRVVL